MASSTVAFSKLRNWKKSKTVLKVTVLTKGGKPKTLTGLVMAADEKAMLVSFACLPSRDMARFDVTGALFKEGRRFLEAARSEEEILTFEDTGETFKVDKRSPQR